MSSVDDDATLRLADDVARTLVAWGTDVVVIGAIALAFHRYMRATVDVDLAIAVPPTALPPLAERLRAAGFDVALREPDADDPLGGVLDVRRGAAGLVQVVNFDNSPANGFPRLVREASVHATPIEQTALRVVDLPSLVAFKLYAGGPKSALDVLSLLERNDVDLGDLQARCDSLGLGRELESVLALRGRFPAR